VMVAVTTVEVSNPAAGFGEFEVLDYLTGAPETLRVDADVHLYSGYGGLMIGDQFTAIQGPLYYSFGDFKVLPRSDYDFIP